MQPFAKKNAAERQFGGDAYNYRQQSFLVALEDTKRQVSNQQNAGDESRRNIAIVESEEGLSPSLPLGRRSG
jgi:hypothetical protein